MSEDAVIVAAVRTPIGKLGGAFAAMPATSLGAVAIRAALARAGVDPATVDDVIVGQVLQAGAGQNPARQSAIAAGVPQHVPAMTINQVCGGGQRSLHLAAQAIRTGDASIIVAGGQDSMTLAPHVLPASRRGLAMGDVPLKDTMLTDGLIDAFHGVHMGVTAERLARRYQITRAEQDALALESQQRAAAAVADGRFDGEIVPVEVRQGKGTIEVTRDEHPRETSLERLAALRPIFEEDGTITAGNSSGLNDGAAALVVMSASRASALGLTPLARIAAYASAGVDPLDMGLGPVPATQAALRKAGWTLADVELAEINEAFAAQAIAVNRELGIDPTIVNVNGGAIALGHPLGGSGARLVVTLVHEMIRRDLHRGLATMCIGGGQGVAICLDR